jgi:hypothetical protein
MIAMLVANHAVHSTRSKHNRFYWLFWHFHNSSLLSEII